jgi:hypothetical protein
MLSNCELLALKNFLRANSAAVIRVMPRKAEISSTTADKIAPAQRQPVRKKPAPKRKMISRKQPHGSSEISDEAIRTRAYFLCEIRTRTSMPGDANSDWVEARRQLIAELSRA